VPVLITGAGGFVGRALIPLVARWAPEVRAVVRRRDHADALRALGVKVAVAELSDLETLSLTMRGVHTVCHLAGGLDLPDEPSYEEANLHTVRWALEAAREAKAARFLFLSYPGASPGASNPYLRAKGEAEEAVRASGLEHVIVRATHIYGRGSRWLEEMVAASTGRVAFVVGPGSQRVAPVAVEDVASVLVAADDRAEEVGGTLGLQGPDEVTVDRLVDLVAGRPRRVVHLSPRRAALLGRLRGRRFSPSLLEVLAADSLADAPDAAAEFSVPLTPLLDGLRRAIEATD
jgi:uncharacterized protein YbjT (DUF2867 family)